MTTEPVLDKKGFSRAVFSIYGILLQDIEFLPLGSDVRSFSYKGSDAQGAEYFLKLRLPNPHQALHLPTAVFVMNRVEQAIRPYQTRVNSRYWMDFDLYQVSIFPYVPGVSGWHYSLSADQWREMGRSVRSLHDIVLPASMAQSIPQETYSDFWRARARQYLDGDKASWSTDSSAKSLTALLREKRAVLLDVINRTRALSERLKQQTFELVCCHGDLHSGNLLVDQHGTIHLIDWDTLSLAPKEKDLMFLGGGIGGMLDDKEGTIDFYEGYGRVEVNPTALRYFRFERIVQDVVAYCEQLLETSEGGADRATMLGQVISQFENGGVIDIAYNTNDILEAE